MSLIEGDSIYNLFQNQDLGLDFASSIVPDSPNKFKKNINNNNNNNNSNVFNNFQQQMQSKQQSNNLIYNNNNNHNHNNNHNSNNNSSHNGQQVYINNTNNNQEEQLFSIYLQPEKENEHHHNHNDNHVNNNNNNNSNNNNNNNLVHNNHHNNNNNNQFYQIKNPMEDLYSSNGIVPNSDQNKKVDFVNEPIKQNHYNIVPESIFDVPFGIPTQSMLNVPSSNKMNNFKQPIHPNQLIPIPPNNNNNSNNNLSSNQLNINNQINNLNNNITNSNNQLSAAGNNNKNGGKKEEDKTIKKRKFISSTPVKGENGGTTLIPTTDVGFNMDEERHQKRQRRLVKNREAAQLFRQRQKAYIQDLEKKVSDLTGTNSEFRARVELLNSENKLIREQLLYLRNFVTQAVSFSFPKGAPGSSTGANSPSGVADQFLNSILPPGLNSPLPQGILPAGMNLQNPMIMSAIAEAASKNSTFRQNIAGNLLGTPIPSPQSSLSSNSGNNSPIKQQLNPSSPNSSNISPTSSTSSSSHQVPYLSNNTPPQQSTPNQR